MKRVNVSKVINYTVFYAVISDVSGGRRFIDIKQIRQK